VFKITSSGTLRTLHSFDFTDGAYPAGALVQGSDGNFYGTTGGGANTNCSSGCGTIFKITSSGTLTTLYSFNGTDGAFPTAGLVQGVDGNFYGTTDQGGASNNCFVSFPGCGTIFKITQSGTLNTLHSFSSTDGAFPAAALVQGTDGNFYGTTDSGGANNLGTVFQITPSGTLDSLHSFDSTDGANPYGALVQGTDGSFYGTTSSGGANAWGAIFKISTAGLLTVLHSFDGTDGGVPFAGLVQSTDGTFYGTTYQGGTNYVGTVFSLSVGFSSNLTTGVSSKVQLSNVNETNSQACTLGGTTCFSIQQNFFVSEPGQISPTWFQNAVLIENAAGVWYAKQVYCEQLPFQQVDCNFLPKSPLGWFKLSGNSLPLISLTSTIDGSAINLTTSLGGSRVKTFQPSVAIGSSVVAGPLSSTGSVQPAQEPELILVGEETEATASFSPSTSGYVTGGLATSGGSSEPVTVLPMVGECTSNSGETSVGLSWLMNKNQPYRIGFAAISGQTGQDCSRNSYRVPWVLKRVDSESRNSKPMSNLFEPLPSVFPRAPVLPHNTPFAQLSSTQILVRDTGICVPITSELGN
jgi:uncharacterized repeat protein (TIGR03803 family)